MVQKVHNAPRVLKALRALQVGVIGGIAFAFAISASVGYGQDSPVFKVEEDWEMVVNDPDPATNSPQVTFFTSPTVHLEDTYFQLQMNYYADRDYSSGGFHVAGVVGESPVDEARSDTRQTLSTDGDTIRWTSVMAVVENKALFAVRDGYSQEWGAFGGPDYLVRIVPSPVSDLSHYTPQHSLDNVDVGFGGNRVQSITLKEVRLFYQDGRVVTVAVNAQP